MVSIKFRGRRISDGKIIEGSGFYGTTTSAFIVQTGGGEHYPVEVDYYSVTANLDTERLDELYWMLGVIEDTKRPVKPVIALKQRIATVKRRIESWEKT